MTDWGITGKPRIMICCPPLNSAMQKRHETYTFLCLRVYFLFHRINDRNQLTNASVTSTIPSDTVISIIGFF